VNFDPKCVVLRPKNLENDTKHGWSAATFVNDLSQGSQVALGVNAKPLDVGYQKIFFCTF